MYNTALKCLMGYLYITLTTYTLKKKKTKSIPFNNTIEKLLYNYYIPFIKYNQQPFTKIGRIYCIFRVCITLYTVNCILW